ncbi:MAG TPA: putative sulfate exporter family transporter, partial [Candidatus Bathyarchaeia archaeon]|nr:putative sulfate exporter family transporter [Candidatus Bathyarchaeia archaeon]
MPKIDWSSLYKKEDWWALWVGLLLFFLSLPSISKIYLLGWIPGGRAWTVVSDALGFGAAGPANANAWWGLIGVWIFLLLLLMPVAKLIGIKPRSWTVGFSVIFWISMLLWIGSFYSPLLKIFGSSEVGWVFALVIGIILGNMPNLPQSLRDSARGEFFIKTAIVLLGAKILFTTLATVILPVLGAVFLAFPVIWVLAYFLSRKMGMDQKFSAVLSSGVGICGISAAIATAGAIEAPPIYATMISSIIVIFAAIELIVVPWLGAAIFPHNLNAAGVWMALSVKTDGAAAASGAIVSGLLGQGPSGIPAVMAVTTKV